MSKATYSSRQNNILLDSPLIEATNVGSRV